jgi:hypothetical protein
MSDQTVLLGAMFSMLEQEAQTVIEQDKQAPKTGEWFAFTPVGVYGPYKTPIHAVVGAVFTLVCRCRVLEEDRDKWCEVAYSLTTRNNMVGDDYNVSTQTE